MWPFVLFVLGFLDRILKLKTSFIKSMIIHDIFNHLLAEEMLYNDKKNKSNAIQMQYEQENIYLYLFLGGFAPQMLCTPFPTGLRHHSRLTRSY